MKSYIKFQKIKNMESSREKKQGSIGIKINPAYFLDYIEAWFIFFEIWYMILYWPN
jgi:hypothetical protein